MHLFSKLTSKYQATTPKAVRELLNLQASDFVDYEIVDDKTIILRKASSFDVEYYKALSNTLNEWNSDEDETAYKKL